MIALDPQNETFVIITEADKQLDADKQTRFVCRYLTAREESEITDLSEYSPDGTLKPHNGERWRRIFNWCVIDIVNLIDKKSEIIVTPQKEVNSEGFLAFPDSFLSRIPLLVRQEVAQSIQFRNLITEDDSKN